MTCDTCGHPAHAGRCEVWKARIGMTAALDIPPHQCPCATRRNGDGMDTTPEPSDAPAGAVAVDNMEKVAGMVRQGDEVVAEMKRIQGKLDAAFPLLTEFRDRMRARLGGTR